MKPMNINREGGNQSSYRLRGEPVKLFAKTLVGARPDGDGWEQVWDETWGTNYDKVRVKPGVPRKQAAARQAIPLSTVKLVNMRTPAPPAVVLAKLENRTADEIKIAELEAKIRELMGLVTQ
jgi:hypothetical protein